MKNQDAPVNEWNQNHSTAPKAPPTFSQSLSEWTQAVHTAPHPMVRSAGLGRMQDRATRLAAQKENRLR